MIKNGYYECDFCHEGTTGEFYRETGNHVSCQDMAAKDAKIAELEMVILGMTTTLDEFFALAEKALKGGK